MPGYGMVMIGHVDARSICGLVNIPLDFGD